MIPFAYNDLDSTLFTPIVYHYTGPVPNPTQAQIDDINNWTNVDNRNHLCWLIDYESGVFSYMQHWMRENITDLSGEI